MSNSRSVFVGNIPYDGTEQQLIDLFSSVGDVVSFRLVSDRDTGKPKGYGFCEFKDSETAKSAIRNLNNVEFHGRSLRVDFAADDKSAQEESASTQKAAQDMLKSQANDPLSRLKIDSENMIQVINSVPDDEKLEVLSQMKILISQNPDGARQLLMANPQLAQALLHIQVSLGLLELPDLLNFSMKSAPPAREMIPQNAPQMPRAPMNVPPTGQRDRMPMDMPMNRPPRGMPMGGPPPQQPMQRGPPMRGAPNRNLPPDQQAMLEEVLNFSPEQIRDLPPEIQRQVRMLQADRMGGFRERERPPSQGYPPNGPPRGRPRHY